MVNEEQWIFWDWNGTLIDDVQVALDAVNLMRIKKERKPISMEQYREAMSTPIIHFYEKFFDMNTTTFAWIAHEFNTYYQEHWREVTLHDGVYEMLKQYQEQGCHQVILSAAYTSDIEARAKQLHIDSFFETIIGSQNLKAESKIQHAKEFFLENKLLKENVLLIGDSMHDWETSQSLGVECILFSGGHQSKKQLNQTGNLVIDSLYHIGNSH